MSAGRTAWHVWFAIFVKETAPPDTEVRFEIVLTTELVLVASKHTPTLTAEDPWRA